jgi:hypothetical protein
MTLNEVLYQIRKSDGKPFRLAYVRSTGKSKGSVNSKDFTFADFIDTNEDIIKLTDVEKGVVNTLKISHILSYNKQPIIRQ